MNAESHTARAAGTSGASDAAGERGPAAASDAAVPLTRAALAAAGIPADKAPVRHVHIGLGAFHRAHQAWYTQRAADGWGIASFTGRSPRQAELLAPQDGVYALVVRGADRDDVDLITSLSEVHDGANVARLCELLADPAVGVVTLTITEAGYHLDGRGDLDLADPVVQADIAALHVASARRATAAPTARPQQSAAEAPPEPHIAAGEQHPEPQVPSAPPHRASSAPPQQSAEGGASAPHIVAGEQTRRGEDAAPTTALGRLLCGLVARRDAGAGAIAVVPCDNIPANGELTRRALTALAESADPELARWVGDNVSFVSTSIDRITPANDGEVDAVIAAGWHDRATVVTEPFADWVLQGAFPAGRPDWERGGARFVDDIEPWEDRKLWLLNGAHTTLVTSGLARGHATVAEAFADPACRDLVEAFWAEAVSCLPADVETADYRRQLAERFANPRIVHRLIQIAAECTTKVRYRIAPIAVRRRARGEDASAAADALAAWITALRSGLLTAPDAEHDAAAAAAREPDPVRALLHVVGADTDDAFVDRVRRSVASVTATQGAATTSAATRTATHGATPTASRPTAP